MYQIALTVFISYPIHVWFILVTFYPARRIVLIFIDWLLNWRRYVSRVLDCIPDTLTLNNTSAYWVIVVATMSCIVDRILTRGWYRTIYWKADKLFFRSGFIIHWLRNYCKIWRICFILVKITRFCTRRGPFVSYFSYLR